MAISKAEDAMLEPQLDKIRHVKYWTRCIKTLLPHQYTSNDSNRMYLAFFIVSALDLLDALDAASNEEERQGYINWVYRCQHPDGGFRMWPGTDLGARSNPENAQWDPANIPATYFALSILLILKDDFKRVNYEATLAWLPKMQRPDGSFGETLVNGRVEGGQDPRFGYCATGIRFMLRGSSTGDLSVNGRTIPDVDLDAFVRCVRVAEAYEGGIADAPFHEPHAGYTFCSLGALAFIGRLSTKGSIDETPPTAPCDPGAVVSWLVHRQTELTDPDAGVDSEFTAPQDMDDVRELENGKTSGAQHDGTVPAHQDPVGTTAISIFDLLVDGAGMNGRINKVADTCYGFWSGASLHIMQQPKLYDQEAIRRYLIGKTQHPVLGGHGKFPGDLPDLLHSYLGLAALSLAGCGEIKAVDARMCLSKDACARLPAIWQSFTAGR
ncbi:geranylgeranyl transferase type-1 subunit beta [Elasticomyces elasticus]|nr:geranylgeranyl transferase type-1 subunit beta [Elasticomyces elasticus]KAK3648305.1 geranylgeranyl transferase type-1 subunit beta [Elasticomyces elasticus]KAK4916295.1 geranylgeranyl transferase type-1 subunit beta [Elasticomyces elasticus]KAK5764945.1 geranylgeranyl transferase type-1 subunit beta [Elasticomyces elasticus]